MVITEKAVQKQAPNRTRQHFYDNEVTGFGLRVDPHGRKSFFWRGKVRGKVRFKALGEFPVVPVKEARDAARDCIGKAAKWRASGYEGPDPFVEETPAAPANVPTFRELTEAYITSHIRETANKPEPAEYDVRWILKKRFADWLDKPLDRITVEDVLRVKNSCGQHKYMANRCTEFARAIFNWSAKAQDGKINFWRVANPANDVSSFEEKERERFLQPVELARFNETLKKEEHRDLADFLTLAMATGARRSDIFSMRWEDVQWERHIWRVPFPKNGESYEVQLLPAARAVLERRRALVLATDKYVFPGVGKTGHLTDLKKPWHKFRKAAQIPDITVHDLRRTVGSYLAMAGTNLPQIGAALGHKSLQSVKVYARFHTEAVRDAREAGQRKMLELMRAAKRRTKLTAASEKKLLTAAVGRG